MLEAFCAEVPEDKTSSSSSCSDYSCRAAYLYCDAFSKFFLCTASAPCGRCLQRQGVPSAEPAPLVRLLSSCFSLQQVHHRRRFCFPSLCLGRLQDPCSIPAYGVAGEGCGRCHPFPPPKAAFPTRSPRNPHFLIFKSKEILCRGGDGGERAEHPGAGGGLSWGCAAARAACWGGRPGFADGRKPSCLSSCFFSSLLLR